MNRQSQTFQHGVLMMIEQRGVLLVGKAGIGKSSLALELLYQGCQLVADDCIEVFRQQEQIYGRCPPLSRGMLHTRELGLLAVTQLFGPHAWQPQTRIDYVVSLHHHGDFPVQLEAASATFAVAGTSLPMLRLDIRNPASLVHRLRCWLHMQSLPKAYIDDFRQRQQRLLNA